MLRWSWIDRDFDFDFPSSKFPDLMERMRGTPARIEERLLGIDHDLLTRSDGNGWTIQENAGHLTDTESLFSIRAGEFLSGAAKLTAADMSGSRTKAANHNNADINHLLTTFRGKRMEQVEELDMVGEELWAKSAFHPRLQKQMRLVDHVYFICEHDDYHLGRIGQLIRIFSLT